MLSFSIWSAICHSLQLFLQGKGREMPVVLHVSKSPGRLFWGRIEKELTTGLVCGWGWGGEITVLPWWSYRKGNGLRWTQSCWLCSGPWRNTPSVCLSVCLTPFWGPGSPPLCRRPGPSWLCLNWWQRNGSALFHLESHHPPGQVLPVSLCKGRAAEKWPCGLESRFSRKASLPWGHLSGTITMI